MAEADMRHRLIDSLRALDAVPVENCVGLGTPDVNYVNGWIELKWLRAWPVHADTIVRLDHPLTPEQGAWLARRWGRGGFAWCMLQCRREWFLFTGDTAKNIVGCTTQQGLIDAAVRYWPNGLNEQELIEVLSGSKI
jgi:hypothetical protein